jgi:hypothetical protein
VSPKITCSSSLGSNDPYQLLQKVSKNPHAFAIHSNMPKTRNAIFWPLKKQTIQVIYSTLIHPCFTLKYTLFQNIVPL